MSKTMKTAGLISLGGYLPAKPVPEEKCNDLVKYLREETLLYSEYIDEIEETGNLPGRIETNFDGWESQPWFEAWLEKLPSKKRADPFQGAEERRRVPMDPVSIKKSLVPHPMLSSDAETLAAAIAIFNSGIDKDEIDLVLCSSLVPDFHVPMDASLVQHKLGLKNAGAYNVDTCCSSFITMMEIAMNAVRCGTKKKVLIVGSALDSIINDKTTYYSVYIGDGAMAGIVGEVEDGYGFLSSHSTSTGSRHEAIMFRKRKPNLMIPTSQGSSHEQEYVTFYNKEQQKEIAMEADQDMYNVVNKTLGKIDCGLEDIDFFVTHQPVPWTPDVWRKALGVPKEKFYNSFKKYGNIAVAAAPTNHLEAIEQGLIKEGDRVLIGSSGVGENHIALYHRVSPELIKNNCLISEEVKEEALC
jgi:3-oxoacyl-[acyl-carrier-protein] synthase-3